MSFVLQTENLGKRYRLGVINRGMLYKDLQSWWARLTHQDDPHEVIDPRGDKAHRGDFWAMRGVNLQVKEGEILGIVGRNGAGKSTLLKVLSRITAPTEGRISLRGRVASLLEVGTGFHGELTGRENIFLNGAILGMTQPEIRKHFDEIVEFAEVAQFIDTPVKRYSSGMYVRLAFAVAAHLQPDILIVDEVLAVGDAAFQRKCLGKMQEVSAGEGRTVLFVSHNMASIANLCSRVAVMHDGRLDFLGATEEGLLRYFTLCGASEGVEAVKTFCFAGKGLPVELLTATIRGTSGPKVNFDIDEPIFLDIAYRVNKPGAQCHVPSAKFLTTDGVCAFITFPTHIRPGGGSNFLATLEIPARFLNDGGYSLDIGMTSYDMHKGSFEVISCERSALRIIVRDDPLNNDDRYSNAGRVPGAVRPRLPWKVEETP